MSSVLRTHAQIPARAKYFLWGASANTSAVPAASAFSILPNEYADVGSMSTVANLTANATVDTTPFTSPPELLKDMGRQITIYDASTYLHTAVYREVQIVSGVDSEGVSGTLASGWNSTYFVKVWSADGAGVNVVRTG